MLSFITDGLCSCMVRCTSNWADVSPQCGQKLRPSFVTWHCSWNRCTELPPSFLHCRNRPCETQNIGIIYKYIMLLVHVPANRCTELPPSFLHCRNRPCSTHKTLVLFISICHSCMGGRMGGQSYLPPSYTVETDPVKHIKHWHY